jgi:hypothetical protein
MLLGVLSNHHENNLDERQKIEREHIMKAASSLRFEYNGPLSMQCYILF